MSDDEVFRALADPSRRKLLDSLKTRSGQNLRELCANLDMARQSVSKHLAILEAADLVVTTREGREKFHFLNAAPITEIGERWISRYDQGRADALTDLKRALEEPPMSETTFVYKTYIHTTPERLWQALTDPAFTSRYWNLTFDTDWKAGSKMVWHNHGVTIDDTAQVVLESDPYTRLSYTWHSFVPGLGTPIGLDAEALAACNAEPRSKATFDLEPQGERVKLTVTHDGFPPGSRVIRMITEGWPVVLSNLKTMLETGAVLPAG